MNKLNYLFELNFIGMLHTYHTTSHTYYNTPTYVLPTSKYNRLKNTKLEGDEHFRVACEFTYTV